MRIVTTTEQLLYDMLQEQKRTNELLEKLIPSKVEIMLPVVEAPTTPAPAPSRNTPNPRRR